jgi:PBSX family phage portal protein
MADKIEDPVELATRDAVFKVQVLGAGVQPPASSQGEEQDRLNSLLRGGTTLAPPVPPTTLLRIWENSGSLNQNVEAYMTNIDGLGWRLEPVLDFDNPQVREQVREAAWAHEDTIDDNAELPSNEEVDEMLVKLKQRARLERVRLTAFLENANPDGSFVSLRRSTRQQLEIIGNAYWEVLRNQVGRPARFVLVPSTSVRLTSLDEKPTKVVDKVPAGATGFAEVVQYRFFRRYVQAVGKAVVWFKEFGDPRVVSRMTGKVYRDKDAWEADRSRNPADRPATEIIHYALRVPGEAYGVPRWFGNLLAVLGSRAAEEVNYDYFDNKAIPPLALLVSGGGLGADAVSKIETYIRDNLKGRQNFHKILIIEAKPTEAQALSGDGAMPRLAFERLGELQKGDALFQQYDERNVDKIGSSFRLPRLMRGDVRDFNRATAIASLRFAEEQVFEPERTEFDAQFNRRILPELDVSLWRFRSNGHRTRDPEAMSEIIERLVRRGVITINEGRDLAADVMGRSFDPLAAFWAKQPLAMTLAGIRPDGDEGEPSSSESKELDDELQELQAEAQRLARLRDEALEAARDQADSNLRNEARVEAELEETDESARETV